MRGFWVLMMVLALGGAAECQKAPAKAVPKARAAAEAGKAAPMSAEQVEALRADLKKMRVLLDQMETNLGFVGSGPTPLKHQFELEIEMWRTLLEHMEKQVGDEPRLAPKEGANLGHQPPGHPAGMMARE